jgi:phosphonate transport system substrate-binding protein
MEELMKKSLLAVALPLVLASCTSAAPGGDSSEPVNTGLIPETLVVQFVPSTSIDSALLTRVKGLEDMLEVELEEAGFDINVNISIGTSYASVIEAMASGQVHAGFLTAQQYAFATLEFPGKFDVQLTSVRSAYAAQVDAEGKEITDKDEIIANVNDAAYTAALHPTMKANSYYSGLFVKADKLAEFEAQGMDWLIGKTVATQNNTSGSGYLYPAFAMHQNNLKFVDANPNVANREVERKIVGGHQNSLLALLNDEVDATFTFLDARLHATAFNAWKEANPGKSQFEETKLVALTDPIYNDTITTIAGLNAELKGAIQDAFINIVQTEEGAAALAIYNHTGYVKAVDADYQGERDFYLFLESLKD